MSAAVVHRPRTILPKFNFLLAGGAVVLSIIAITDNVGSNSVTATATKPAAATVSAAPARGLHEPGEYFQQAPSVGRLLNDVGPVQA
ncbi:MAG: hypothetical protein ABJD24_18625, partial [Acidimicrobiales bacterium]